MVDSAGTVTAAQRGVTATSMHGDSKTATAFLKANNSRFIRHDIPEDDLTAAAVEYPPLLSWHSPIPLEVAEASAR